ncbi:hypothetical protein T492DRAFT_859513 [Pavlovales sp. CCMP2436]|nr:hypothetical protein T492DRAFT_859513 [Pavlovales sp. CCMP2436]
MAVGGRSTALRLALGAALAAVLARRYRARQRRLAIEVAAGSAENLHGSGGCESARRPRAPRPPGYARVVVVGLGGVGSHAAALLARAGVRNFVLVDFDNVTLSSLNRYATLIAAQGG